MSGPDLDALEQAVRGRAADFLERGAPEVHLVLGSGLGAVADAVEAPLRVAFADLPGLGDAGVAGHRGEFLFGTLAGVRVLVQAGRVHLYEGRGTGAVTAPVRLGRRLGAGIYVVTNAAGGIARTLQPGDLMVLRDHIDLQGAGALRGPVLPGEERFPDMSAPYDPALGDLLLDVARAAGDPLHEGVYAAVRGPSFETPAEIRMLARLGADAVGMSTVPEVIVARAGGSRVLGVSMISNKAAGLGPPLSHSEVLETGKKAGQRLAHLLIRWLTELRAERPA